MDQERFEEVSLNSSHCVSFLKARSALIQLFARCAVDRRSGFFGCCLVVMATVAVLAGTVIPSVASAQPEPFLSPLGPSGLGGVESLGLRVSPTGEWVAGTQGTDTGIFLWRRSDDARFVVPASAGGALLAPAFIDERLSIVAANGWRGFYLLDDTGMDWIYLGNLLSPQYRNMAIVGMSDEGRVIGLSGEDASGERRAIALEGQTVLDLGSVVKAQLGLEGGEVYLLDVAAGRPTSIGYIVTGDDRVQEGWLYDHRSGLATRISSPGGEHVAPLAVSEDGVAVTGVLQDQAGAIEAFYWTRRGSPIDGPYAGSMTRLGRLNSPVPYSLGFAIDAAGHNVAGVSQDANGIQAVVWQNFNWVSPILLKTATAGLAGNSLFPAFREITDVSANGVMTGYGENQSGVNEAFAARLEGWGCKLEFDFFPGLTYTDSFVFFSALGAIETDINLDGVVDQDDIQVYLDGFLAGQNRTVSGCK